MSTTQIAIDYPWANTSIKAVLFDMDGTLVDSEIFTEQIVKAYLAEAGLTAPKIDYELFHGVTWEKIAESLRSLLPERAESHLAHDLERRFHHAMMNQQPAIIAGAPEAVRKASENFSCAVVSSSNRETVDYVVKQLQLDSCFKDRICSEDVSHSKPHPECYETAAHRLGIQTDECLVFEDSLAGLEAARSAGMWTVAITHQKSEELKARACQISHHAILDFRQLTPQFFQSLSETA